MKRFFAIALGLLLVFGTAVVAVADVTATGEFEFYFGADGTTLNPDYTDVSLKIANEYSDTASGSITVMFDAVDATHTSLRLDAANFSWRPATPFTLDVIYSYGGYLFFDASDEGVLGENDFITIDPYLVKAAVDLSGGSAAVYFGVANKQPDFYATVTYPWRAATLNAILGYSESGKIRFLGKAGVRPVPELLLTGYLNYDYDQSVDVAAKANYAGQVFAVDGMVTYDTTEKAMSGYKLEIYLETMKNPVPYTYYDMKDGFGVGATYYFNGAKAYFDVQYNQGKAAGAIYFQF